MFHWLNQMIITSTTKLLMMGPRDSLGKPIEATDFSDFFQNFKKLGIAISGLCTMTSLMHFIISLTKLSASAGNDRARSTAIKGVLFSGVALALFGGITTVVAVFWNAFT